MTRWIIRCTSAWLMLVTLAGPAAAEWVLWKIETTLSLSNKTRQEPRDAFDTKALCMTNAQQRLATAARPDSDLYSAVHQMDGAPGYGRCTRSYSQTYTERRGGIDVPTMVFYQWQCWPSGVTRGTTTQRQ